MTRLVLEHCALASAGEHPVLIDDGHIAIEDGRIAAIGSGNWDPSGGDARTRTIDCRGLLATPGLVNTHHHLYQWLTRGYATDSNLFDWLTTLYPVWALIDDEMQAAAARAGLAALALSGCSTTTDHHYLFPRSAGDLLEVEIEAARAIGLRFHPCRGSMDLGRSQGGLPPDSVVEDREQILEATAKAIDRFHDDSFGSMLRIAVAPCSPFSVTRELMTESAELARRTGVRLHTHMAETVEEETFCLESFGMRPVEYIEELGWLGDDVWLAHCVHLSPDEVSRFGAAGTGVAHCPSSNARLGAGIAPVAGLLASGAPVGLGVDGAASNESGELSVELREALLFGRLRSGPDSISPVTALEIATLGGARCLGRAAELGTLEAGKVADVALWRMDDIAHSGIQDPVTALALGPPSRVHHLIVDGRVVVEAGELVTADQEQIVRDIDGAGRRLAEKAEAT